METKKNPKLSLERQRPRFFLIGLSVALGVTLCAFEWTTHTTTPKDLGAVDPYDDVDVIDIPITIVPEKIPPKSIQTKANLSQNFHKAVNEIKVGDTEPSEDPIIELESLGLKDIDLDDEFVHEPDVDWFTENPGVWPKFQCTPDKLTSDAEVMRYLGRSTTFPRIGLERGERGTVWVQFIVNKQGEVQDVEILRGIGHYCDKEALRVVQEMPDWCPGEQFGNPVSVRYRLPIKFITN